MTWRGLYAALREMPGQDGRAHRVAEAVAAESVQVLAIAANQYQVAILRERSPDGVPGDRHGARSADEDGADVRQEQCPARLSGIVGYADRRAEVAAVGADGAMAGHDRVRATRGDGGPEVDDGLETLEHFPLNLEALIVQAGGFEPGAQGRRGGRVRAVTCGLPIPLPFARPGIAGAIRPPPVKPSHPAASPLPFENQPRSRAAEFSCRSSQYQDRRVSCVQTGIPIAHSCRTTLKVRDRMTENFP